MNGLRVYFVPNRLSDALARAAPRSVKQGLDQAEENLKRLGPECAAHVDRTLARLGAILEAWPETPECVFLTSIYEASLSLIGAATIAGLPNIDCTAKSLCDVVDGMLAQKLWEREPIAVHVQALRLLRHPDSLQDDVDRILDGLARVRSRFAVDQILSQSNSCVI